MYIKVLVELSAFNIDKTFTYHVSDDLIDNIKVGIRVLVPFNNQKLEGFVLEIIDEVIEEYDIKDIISVVDSEPILTNELLELGKFVRDETLSTLISAYQAMLPKALKAKNGSKVNIKYQKIVEIDNLIGEITPKQQEIIDKINEKGKCSYTELKKINSSVDTLLKKGILKIKDVEIYREVSNSKLNYPRHELNKEQKLVYDEVVNNLNKEITYLLYGVTGSGKTEVYMDLFEKVISLGKTCLLLVPEITLTNQILKRMEARFSDIAVLHSGLSDGERYDEYRRIKKGEAKIVIGARSSIFAPLDNIGIIIIDECHTESFKQDVMPKYDAIEVAKYRSKVNNCPLILGSATPTLEMYARASKGLYKLLRLPNRAGVAKPPKITICDMTKEEHVKNTTISKTLFNEINNKLNLKEQIILLQNRRGYSSILMCQNCGYTMKCPNCDISLTYHKTKELMRCHYCGYATKKINVCPDCKNDSLKELGTGTERIEEEIKSLFPTARVVRMDLDTTTRKGAHDKIITAFAKGEYDILLGTQMISKGLDFPNVTLVGILNADTSLFIPSYKSNENTFDLISQVSGRSGRSEKNGEVIIQTYNPDHFAITLASNDDYEGFYQEEMQNRLAGRYPPYFYLTMVTVKSIDYELVSKEINKIKTLLETKLPDKEVIGPSLGVPFKINNLYRFNIIIKYKKELDLKNVLRDLIEHYKSNYKIKIEVTFNPNNI
jgi:primosomal protein N' (replication factor Y)